MNEPTTREAWIEQVAEAFQNATGKMILSPVDYDTIDALERTDMPVACALEGITASLARFKGPRHRVSFKYCEHAIHDQFEAWKRAVGPGQ